VVHHAHIVGGRGGGEARHMTGWPYAQVVDDDVLVIETSWPATTIDGDPGIVSGMLSVRAHCWW
jgi:hypothetical protein